MISLGSNFSHAYTLQRASCQYRRLEFTPWVRKTPGRQVATHSSIVLGKLHGQRSLGGYASWGCRVGHEWVTGALRSSGRLPAAPPHDWQHCPPCRPTEALPPAPPWGPPAGRPPARPQASRLPDSTRMASHATWEQPSFLVSIGRTD